MAWTAPRTWVVGELVTAAIMNTHIRDNLSYITTWSQHDVTGTRAVDGTVYQNTTDWIMVVTIAAKFVTDVGSSTLVFVCDAGAAPATDIGSLRLSGAAGTLGDDIEVTMSHTFVVLPNYYYKATATGAGGGTSPTLDEWFEWSAA